jgi:hypothetical protein
VTVVTTSEDCNKTQVPIRKASSVAKHASFGGQKWSSTLTHHNIINHTDVLCTCIKMCLLRSKCQRQNCLCTELIKHNAMKAYGGVDVQNHIILPSVLVGEWSASRPGHFASGEDSDTNWTGGWVGPRTSPDDVEGTKLLAQKGLERRPLNRPARSQSLYRLRCPTSSYCDLQHNMQHIKYKPIRNNYTDLT